MTEKAAKSDAPAPPAAAPPAPARTGGDRADPAGRDGRADRGADADHQSADRAQLAALVQRAADGDASAWRDLVERYSRRVVGLIFRQCGDRDLAEEITQAAFVKVLQAMTPAQPTTPTQPPAAGYAERGRFEPWLFRVAMNLLRDEMRRRKRQARPMDMTPGAGAGATASTEDGASAWAAVESGRDRIVRGSPSQPPQPLETLSQREQLTILRRAVAQLGEADAQIIHLRHTAGLSFPQIAETLDQPLGTVLARGHRALKKLRKIMETEGVAA